MRPTKGQRFIKWKSGLQLHRHYLFIFTILAVTVSIGNAAELTVPAKQYWKDVAVLEGAIERNVQGPDNVLLAERPLLIDCIDNGSDHMRKVLCGIAFRAVFTNGRTVDYARTEYEVSNNLSSVVDVLLRAYEKADRKTQFKISEYVYYIYKYGEFGYRPREVGLQFVEKHTKKPCRASSLIMECILENGIPDNVLKKYLRKDIPDHNSTSWLAGMPWIARLIAARRGDRNAAIEVVKHLEAEAADVKGKEMVLFSRWRKFDLEFTGSREIAAYYSQYLFSDHKWGERLIGYEAIEIVAMLCPDAPVRFYTYACSEEDLTKMRNWAKRDGLVDDCHKLFPGPGVFDNASEE